MTAVEGIAGAIALVSSLLLLIFTFLARMFRGFEIESRSRDIADERSRRDQESKSRKKEP